MATGPPVLPKWLFYLRIAIIVLSLGVLIAAGVNVAAFDSWTRWSASSGPGGFLIFDVIFTWIILGTMLVFEFWYHQFYLRLAYVVLLPLAAIFWLSAWAWAASVASVFRGSYGDSFFGSDDLDRYSSSIAACAALGAFTWVAIIVLTIFYIVACLRDNNDTVHQTEMGMPSKTETTPAPAAVPNNGATGFNQQTQDYYSGQPPAQHEVQHQQAPYSQEMPSADQYQQPQQGTPYPNEHNQRQ